MAGIYCPSVVVTDCISVPAVSTVTSALRIVTVVTEVAVWMLQLPLHLASSATASLAGLDLDVRKVSRYFYKSFRTYAIWKGLVLTNFDSKKQLYRFNTDFHF